MPYKSSAVQSKVNVDVEVKLPNAEQVIEQFRPSPTDVLSTAVPEYDHVSLVSEAEKESVDRLYVSSPGIGVFRVPAMDVETDSDVSPSTRAPEMLGVTVNEYVAPPANPLSEALRAVLPTVRVCGATGASTSVTMKSSRSIFPDG